MIRGALLAVALLALAPTIASGRQSPEVTGLAVAEEAGVIVASGNLSVWMSKEVKEAIDGSLPVTVRYRAELFSPRRVWDRVVARATVTKTMRYDRVKETFLLSAATGDGPVVPVEATNAAEAERWVATLEKTPLAPVASLAQGRPYRLRVQAEIELSRRSFPLNLLLFFVPSRNERTAWAVSPPLALPGTRRP